MKEPIYCDSALEALLNPDLSLVKGLIPDIKPGPNQTAWIEVLEKNPPKTRNKLARADISTKEIIGTCCLGEWMLYKKYPHEIVSESGTIGFNAADDINTLHLPLKDVEELGLFSHIGVFRDNMVIVLDEINGKFYSYAKHAESGVFPYDESKRPKSNPNLLIIHSLTNVNDYVTDTHEQTAKFIRKFPGLVFESSK